MSAVGPPENVEDIQQIVSTPEAVADKIQEQTGGQPVCPPLADIIYAALPPEAQQIISFVNSGVAAAQSAAERAKNPPSGSDIKQEINSFFSNTATAVNRAVERKAEEIKEEAGILAARIEDEINAAANSASQLIKAVEQGVIDIGTDLQNIDQITLNAMEKEFPGFKSAIDCLKGGEEGSSAREAGIDGPKDQANTPASENTAATRSGEKEDKKKTIEDLVEEERGISQEELEEASRRREAAELAQRNAIIEQQRAAANQRPRKVDSSAPIDYAALSRGKSDIYGKQTVYPYIHVDKEENIYYAIIPLDEVQNVFIYDLTTKKRVGSTTKSKLKRKNIPTNRPPQWNAEAKAAYNARVGRSVGDPS